MTKQTREELIAEMTTTMETAKELGMEDMVAYYEKEIKLVTEISEEHLASYQSGCVRSQQMLEKEQHRQLDLRIRNMIVEIHKDVMRCDWDNVESNTEHLEKLCREDMILLTGDKDLVAPASWFESWSVATEGMKSPNGEPDQIVKSILNTTRNDYPRHLSIRHTGETELLRLCDYEHPHRLTGLFDQLKGLNIKAVSENIPEPLFPAEGCDDSVVDPRRHILGATMYLSRTNMILQLEMWQNQAARFKLVAQGLIFAKEIDRLKSISDEEYDDLEQKVNPDVIKAVIYLSEVHTQNVLAARRGTISSPDDKPISYPMFRGVWQMNREQYIEFLQGWRKNAVETAMTSEIQAFDLCIKDLGNITDEQYKDWKVMKQGDIATTIQRVAKKLARGIMGDEKFGTRAVIRNEQPTGRSKETRNIGEVEIPYTGRLKGIAKRVISPDELPTDESGAVADINAHDKPLMGSYLQSAKPEGYSSKLTTNQPVMERLTAEKEMLQVFCTILSKEMADRLARDLEHLINITDDAEYAEAISQEVRRIRLFAEGRIKTLSDVNFAWIYHDK